MKTTASGTVYFLYSVFGLEAEFNASGDLIQGYLFGADTYSTNPILTYKPNASNGLDYHYYHNDHLFTPQRLTDSTGVLSWSADYSAFGETTVTKEDITSNLRFPGQYYDVDIKLAQNYYRDYSAELGRYVETDPIGLDGGINFYGYGEQNPNYYADYNGKFLHVLIPVFTFYCVLSVASGFASGTCDGWGEAAKNCILGGILGTGVFAATGGLGSLVTTGGASVGGTTIIGGIIAGAVDGAVIGAGGLK